MEDFGFMAHSVKPHLTFSQAQSRLQGKPYLSKARAMTLAKRIKAARKSVHITQEELGKRLGVSKAAVSQWEGAATTPDVHNLLRISEVTHVPIAWLLTGQPLPEQATNGTLRWEHVEGRTVPLLTMKQAVTGLEYIGAPRVSAAFPCSSKAFALIIDSRANAPVLLPGDRAIWEPVDSPEPDDIVLATFGEAGIPAIGRVRFDTNQSGTVTIIQPVNPSFPAFRSDHGALRILAVLHEHTRSARA